MPRIIAFDYIRALSTICILLCHFCFNWEESAGIGRWLGSTFNVVFLCISALLIGDSWAQKDFPSYNTSFLKHRFVKLSVSYYPFLIGMFLFILITENHVSPLKIVMDVTFLPWFNKTKGFEHLWFLTMIAICYCTIWIQSKFKKVGNKVGLPLVILAGVAHFYCLKHGLPGQMLSYLIVFLLIHNNAKDILLKINNANVLSLSILTIIIVSISIYLFNDGLYMKHRFLAEWCGIICAIIILFLLLRLFKDASSFGIINFTSKISFEIYLVHHIFAFGNYSVIQICSNPVLALLLLVSISYVLASVLHIISNRINSWISC